MVEDHDVKGAEGVVEDHDVKGGHVWWKITMLRGGRCGGRS